MTIPILVESCQAGFRAATGGPLDLTAEAPSAAEALALLREKIKARFKRGAIIIHDHIPAPRSPIPLIPLAENPLVDEWLTEVEKYREEQELEDRAAYG